MRIVVLNHYAGTLQNGMVYRTAYLGAQWAKSGHEVDVYAASWSHMRTVNPPRVLREEVIAAGLRYHWVPTTQYRGNGPGRIVSMLQYSLRTWLDARSIAAKRPDAVIVSSPHPIAIWSGHRIAQIARAALVFEVRDLWPRTLTEIGQVSPHHPFVKVLACAERYACRNADLVVSLLPAAWPHHSALGVQHDRHVVIPNGIDPDEWTESANHPAAFAHATPAFQAIASLRDSGRKIVGYFGAHGLANALDTLIDAAALLRDQPIGFVLVGQGPAKDALQARARELGLNAVRFAEPVPKAELAPVMRACDVLYAGTHDSPLYRFGASFNKLFDYLCAGRPVLLAADIEEDAVTASAGGRIVPPDDPNGIAAAIQSMTTLPAAELDRIGLSGRRWVLAHHAYPLLAQRYLHSIETALKRRHS